MRKIVFAFLVLALPLASFSMPNSTFPQNPGFKYYPELQKGFELDPFNRPPQNYILTGNDKATTRSVSSGLDTTPVDDTGTEIDIHHKQQPDWIPPHSPIPLTQTQEPEGQILPMP